MTEIERDNCLIQLVKSVNNLDSRIDSIDTKLNENIEFTKRISSSVAVIEEKHGSKLKALFNGYKCNSEKLDKIETDIKNIHSILQRHDDEIYLIKSR